MNKDIQQNWKEELQNVLNCDLKSLYPMARSLKRELHFYVGPTNSGKTYRALKELKEADCGLYLAPLRLLALEGYEDLVENGVNASLITGEEQIVDEEAAHICSTIEMIDYDLDVDVAVIDEVQMLADIDRGWAWVNAILGVPAKKVIMTGSVNALDAIKKIAAYLGEELTVIKHKRKNELHVMSEATPLNRLKKGTALIAFSRADVLQLKRRLQKQHKVSVIYGNLSPEVRRDEARRFREGKSDILIATDAIAMGLNLPIKTILFTTDRKFDGVSKRLITVNEIVQIAGRAGRYGHHEMGYIGATSAAVLKHIQKTFHAPIKTIKPPFNVKANASQIESLAKFLETNSLTKILKFFADNMYFDGPFKASNISSMITAAKIVDMKPSLKLEDKYMLSQAPLTVKSPLIRRAYEFYLNSILKNKIVRYKSSFTISKKNSERDLLLAEDEVKKISLYLWIAYKLPNLFPDSIKARIIRDNINSYIENSLKSNLSANKDTFYKRRVRRR